MSPYIKKVKKNRLELLIEEENVPQGLKLVPLQTGYIFQIV